MAFSGFPLAALDFYEDLEADNSKAFWTAHKHVYDEAVRAPMEAFCAAVESEFGPAKLFRPYRDMRFQATRGQAGEPYKTHQGAWFGESNLYLQVSAAGLFLAGGYWETSSAQVDRLRRSVADDVAGAALERVLASVRKAGFDVGGETITRVPHGYDKEHPRAELLKHKSLTARRELGCPEWLDTKRAKTEIVKAWRKLAPLTSWLDTHVGRG